MILILLAAAAAQPQAQSPKAWLEHVYASYRSERFNPFDHPDRYFSPRLAAAMAEDARLAKGEVGYLDGDPICQCQDPAGLKARVLRVIPQGPNKASVQVSIGLSGYDARPARFTLVRTRAGWRIDDVSSKDEPSLFRAIAASNREMRRKQR
jgi:hypothetical protein